MVRERTGRKARIECPGLHETAVSDQQRGHSRSMVSRFLEQKRQDIYNGVAPRLHEPDLVDVPKVPVSSAADVEARYHPTGLRAVPTLAVLAMGLRPFAQIDTQTAAIKADQDAKRVIRAGAVEAGSAVRGEVDEAMRKGFFTDPELRK